MIKQISFTILGAAILLSSCNTAEKKETENSFASLDKGTWRGAISLNDSVEVAFTFNTTKTTDSTWDFVINNAEEQIEAKASLDNKGIKVNMPVFSNYLIAKLEGDSMKGFYINPDAKDYKLPFGAAKGNFLRYEEEDHCCDINKKWKVALSTETDKPDPAIAYFVQEGSHLKGTFMTETGDYRYLEGGFTGEHFQLSAFDGAHLFYFSGNIVDERIMGDFYSGRSYYTQWTAERDDDFQLNNPDELTFMYDSLSFDFSFEDLNGNTVSLSDEQFKNQAVIVQILGSWCPNCMDEARYFQSLHQEFGNQNLKIVGVAFERVKDKETALKRVSKLKEDLGIEYTLLLGGSTREDKAAEAFPMLNHIMSYPTAIYLDKNHQVAKIHTGFAGPGTPVYAEYVKENNDFIEQLIN